MPDKNWGIWFTGPGKVELRCSEVPEPVAGEVLIRTCRSLISNGTELAIYNHQTSSGCAWSEFAHFPRPVGYSNAGVVTAVGSDEDSAWIGKRVASRCRHAAWNVASASDLRAIPDSVSDEEATFATLAGVVMNGLRRANLRWGESAAIFGLGIVGQLCVRFAEVAGAGPIFGVDLLPSRLGKLISRASVHALLGSSDDLISQIQKHHFAGAVDLVVEATGVSTLIPNEVKLLRECGRLLLLGSPNGDTNFDFHDLCNRHSLSIVGAHGFSQPKFATPDNPWTSRRHGELFLDWVAAGRITVRELITDHYYFEDAAKAYAEIANNRNDSLGVVFDWQ